MSLLLALDRLGAPLLPLVQHSGWSSECSGFPLVQTSSTPLGRPAVVLRPLHILLPGRYITPATLVPLVGIRVSMSTNDFLSCGMVFLHVCLQGVMLIALEMSLVNEFLIRFIWKKREADGTYSPEPPSSTSSPRPSSLQKNR